MSDIKKFNLKGLFKYNKSLSTINTLAFFIFFLLLFFNL